MNGLNTTTQLERPLPPKPRVKRQGVPTNRPTPRASSFRLKNIVKRSIISRIFLDRFNYSPIANDEIRLLTIQKGRQEDQMNCTISKWKLSEVKECYEALSYCWGTEKPDCAIFIQDLNGPLPGLHNKKMRFEDAVLAVSRPKAQKFH